MKKILSIVLAVLLLVPFAAFPAFAEEAFPEEETEAAEPMAAEETIPEEPAGEAETEPEPAATEEEAVPEPEETEPEGETASGPEEAETETGNEPKAETAEEQPVRTAETEGGEENDAPEGEAPPEIWEQPYDVVVRPDESVAISVWATGEDLTYQWQVSKNGGSTWRNCTSTGYATDTLTFRAKESYTGWMYRCRISNPFGEVISDTALLTVDPDPLIIYEQPEDKNLLEGQPATFYVRVSKTGLTYQWQVSKDGGATWKDCVSTGYNTDFMYFFAKPSYSGWMYRCRISDGTRVIFTDEVTLTVTAIEAAITEQPSDVSVLAQETAAFTVAATGTNLSYQWQVSKDGGTTWKNCTSTGYNTKTLSFSAKLSYSGWMYRCRISNSLGKIYTDAVTLTVSIEAPVITVQPSNRKVLKNEVDTFSCRATGGNCTYQWEVSKDGGLTWNDCNSVESNQRTFAFRARMSYNGWMYRCRVTNEAGTTYTDSVLLTVIPVPEPSITRRLEDMTVSRGLTVNIHVRAQGEELSYRWQVSKDGGKTWRNCTSTGYDTDTLCFTAALKYSGWMYRCIVSNPGGEVISREMVLTVKEPDGYSKYGAYAMKSGEAYSMTLVKADYGKDCYLQFTMPSRGAFVFWMTKPLYKGEPVNFELTVEQAFDTDSPWMAYTSAQNELTDEDYYCAVGLDAGVYVVNLRVRQTDVPNSVEFSFGYTFSAGNWEIEDNNFPNCANEIAVGETYYGMLGETCITPSDDWYTVELQNGKRYALILDNIEALSDIGVELGFYRIKTGTEASLITGVSQVDTALVAILEPDWTDDYCIGIKGPAMKPGVVYALTVIQYEE